MKDLEVAVQLGACLHTVQTDCVPTGDPKSYGVLELLSNMRKDCVSVPVLHFLLDLRGPGPFQAWVEQNLLRLIPAYFKRHKAWYERRRVWCAAASGAVPCDNTPSTPMHQHHAS